VRGAWPGTREALESEQVALGRADPPPWVPPEGPYAIGGVFVTFSTRADPSDVERAWAAAVVGNETAVVRGEVASPYEAGYLALREGPLLERAVRELPRRPDVLLVNASGRDHPRRCGLALHLGVVLDIPTVGVTDRPLVARIDGDRLVLGDGTVGSVVVTHPRARPLCAHAAWRTDPATAAAVMLAAVRDARTPEPIRRARFLARAQRARDEGRLPPGWQMDRLVEPRFPR
jgi:deoxyribonuclease V